jgi:hypothetical protein
MYNYKMYVYVSQQPYMISIIIQQYKLEITMIQKLNNLHEVT